MKRFSRLALVGACCALFASALLASSRASAAGSVLFERSLMVDRSTNIFKTDAFALKFVLGDSYFTPSNPVNLFDGTAITPADVGKTFTMKTGDAGFASVVSRITDSQDQFIQFLLTEKSSGRIEKRGWNERGFFTGVATSTIPDLAGKTIGMIKLSINGFTLTPPAASGTAPLLSGPPVELDMTFTVFAAIPEPASAALVAACLPMLAARRYTAAVRRARRSR